MPNETDEIPVEITPEMIEAGAEVLCGADIWPPDRRRDWAIEVYRAMAALDGSRRPFRATPFRSHSKVLSRDICRHMLKKYLFPFLETICTYWMRRFAALCLWLQEPSDSMPEFFQFISILLGIPCFKASHFFFKLTYSIQQRFLRLSCSDEFFFKFYNRPVASGSVTEILKSLYDIERGLDGAKTSKYFTDHDICS
jgi:hypothetical protein